MKNYIVIVESTYLYETNIRVKSFINDLEGAKNYVKDLYETLVQDFDTSKLDFVDKHSDKSFVFYYDGYYIEDHVHVFIQEEELNDKSLTEKIKETIIFQ